MVLSKKTGVQAYLQASGGFGLEQMRLVQDISVRDIASSQARPGVRRVTSVGPAFPGMDSAENWLKGSVRAEREFVSVSARVLTAGLFGFELDLASKVPVVD